MTEMHPGVRQYGDTPSDIVLLHGGPGGAGEVEPFAKELGRRGHAVLEPFQTRRSVDGQVEELRSQVQRYCRVPVAIIGWSWGAWLGCLLAARHSELVRTLILVGSGPFEPHYAAAIRTAKNARLSDDERAELAALRPSTLRPMEGNSAHVARFIELNDLADTYARDASPQPSVMFDSEIHASVWPEADEMRISGALKDAISAIRCPVLAIHGDYDPRPSEGVRLPLQDALPSARFVQLQRCGHKPWHEVHAKEDFFRLVESAVS